MTPDRVRDEGLRPRHLDDVRGPAPDHRRRPARGPGGVLPGASAAWSAASASAPGASTSCSPTPRRPSSSSARPQGEPISEAVYFHRKLVEAEMPFGGVIVNKVHYEGRSAGAIRREPAAGAAGRRRSATPTSPSGCTTTSTTSGRCRSATAATSSTWPREMRTRRRDPGPLPGRGRPRSRRPDARSTATCSPRAARSARRSPPAGRDGKAVSHRASCPVAQPALPGVIGGSFRWSTRRSRGVRS